MEKLPEKLQQLKQEYIDGIPERFNHITSSLDQLKLMPSDYKALKDLMFCFYGFSSTGTTYGFSQVSLLGYKGQYECETLMKSNLSPSKHDIKRWKTYLLALRKEFFK